MQVKHFAFRVLPLALAAGAAAFLTVSMPSFAQPGQPAPAGTGAPAGGAQALPSAQNAGGVFGLGNDEDRKIARAFKGACLAA